MFKKIFITGLIGIIVFVNRDNFGTTFLDNWARSTKSSLFIGLDKSGKNLAERGGNSPPPFCKSLQYLVLRCKTFNCNSLSTVGRWWSLTVKNGCFEPNSGQISMPGKGAKPMADSIVIRRDSANLSCW